MYAEVVSDEVHIANIVRLATVLTDSHPEALFSGRFRIGPAQKALNLLLELQWCCGWIPTPPHCPFDAVVIQLLDLPHPIAWTKLDTVTGYAELVAAARKVAGDVSLSEWELTEYNVVAPASRRA